MPHLYCSCGTIILPHKIYLTGLTCAFKWVTISSVRGHWSSDRPLEVNDHMPLINWEQGLKAGEFVDRNFGGDVDAALAVIDKIEDEDIRNVLIAYRGWRDTLRASAARRRAAEDVSLSDASGGTARQERLPSGKVTQRRSSGRSRRKPKQ